MSGKMLRQFVFVLTVILGGSSAAFSQSSYLAECMKIQNAEKRMGCYEEGAAKNIEANGAGAWSYLESIDRFTSVDTSLVKLEVKEVISGARAAPSALIVRCNGASPTDIYISTNGYLGSVGGNVPVRYKFGELEAISENWSISTDGTSAFLPSGYKDFRAGILSGEKFVLELTDFRGVEHVSGFENPKPFGGHFNFVWNGCSGERSVPD